jgi:hypothetical protein
VLDESVAIPIGRRFSGRTSPVRYSSGSSSNAARSVVSRFFTAHFVAMSPPTMQTTTPTVAAV